MTSLTSERGKRQVRGTSSPDSGPNWGVVLVAVAGMGSILWIALDTGQTVADAAIKAIAGIVVGAIGVNWWRRGGGTRR